MTAISAQTGAKPASTGVFRAVGHAISELFVAYRRRQTMHELSALDDHLLEDIGVRRTELSAVSMSADGKVQNDLHVPRHQIG